MATTHHHRPGPHHIGLPTTLAYLFLLLSQNTAALLLLPLVIASAVLTLIWIGLPFVILTATLLRALADAQRRTHGHLLPHGHIPSVYRPIPPGSIVRRAGTIITDPATWKDLCWLISGPANLLLIVIPTAFFGHATHIVIYTLGIRFDPALYGFYIPQNLTQTLLPLLVAALLYYLAWLTAPRALNIYFSFNRLLLAPTEKARLTARVAHLATSRANTIDTQAAEIRRIERDLHDGAQARLVALGMNLGMAEQIITQDPDTARDMLAEARESTRQALTELRDLVRGIHPPVLVERGLHGAVQALALTYHLPITVAVDLDGRPADPVESAAYFAVAELLTNTAKHSQATEAWIHINHGRNRLVITIADNGTGGARSSPGSGLAGIRRRLDAFDGTMNITSPPGGPTIVTLEIPCALSSQKTLPSSATG